MLNKKFSVLMLLLIIAASLVGITSIYKPADVQAQVQPKQLRPNAGQALNQQQSPPVGAQQKQQQLERPVQGALERQQSTLQAGMQSIQDRQLAERLLPYIIKGIDGATILQKIDAKTLAAKVLPYIQVQLHTYSASGPVVTVKKSGPFPPDSYHSTSAACPAGTYLVGGGVVIIPAGRGMGDNSIQSLDTQVGVLSVSVKMDQAGDIRAVAKCLNLEPVVSLKP